MTIVFVGVLPHLVATDSLNFLIIFETDPAVGWRQVVFLQL